MEFGGYQSEEIIYCTELIHSVSANSIKRPFNPAAYLKIKILFSEIQNV